ncbi:hypothetical protein C0992_008835 [Termitomyces sp. T32_za158]|nr:hypothetical protein C0992_008835 [Termitomyces sp. T32_za158]
MSDYGEQPEDTPSKDETPANCRLRIAKANKDREEQATECIPDGLGVFVNGMGIEQSNWFFGGALDHHFYYSCFTNTIFVGDKAIAAKAFEDKQGERYYHTSCDLEKVVPRGFPMNPQQLRKLKDFVLSHWASMSLRIQAYYLLCKFQRISLNCHPVLQDRTMALVCTPEHEHTMPPLELSSRHMDIAVMPTLEGYLHWKDWAERLFFLLTGFDSKGVRYTFELDRLAQNVLYFCRPGMQNSMLGIAVDHAYRIHWRTMLGHALTCRLDLSGWARGQFMRLLALILAWPGLYCKAIVDYNAANPLTPFSPMNWMDVQLWPPHFDAATAVNIMDADVLRAMLANRIPVKWIDHAYTFGVVYLETHFFEANASINIYCEVDNDCHWCLDLYGKPLAILQWDDWRVPMEGNMIRLHALLHQEHTQGHIHSAHGLYYPIGMTPNWHDLWQRRE